MLLLARHPRLGMLELRGVQQAGWRALQTVVCAEAEPGRELIHALAFLAFCCIASSSDCLCQKTHCYCLLPTLASLQTTVAASYRCAGRESTVTLSLFLMRISSLFFLCLSWLLLFSGAGYRWIFVILTAMRRFWRGY